MRLPDPTTHSACFDAAVAGLSNLRQSHPSLLASHHYLLHARGSATAWLGLGARRIVNYTRAGYQVVENGERSSVPAGDDIIRRMKDLIDPSRAALFFVSLDLHRPTCDEDLPLISFIQTEAEVSFSGASECFDIATDNHELEAQIRGGLSAHSEPDSLQAKGDIQGGQGIGGYCGESDPHFLDRLKAAVKTLQGVDGKMILTRTYHKEVAPNLDPFLLYKIYSARESGAVASHYVSFGNNVYSIGCSPENVFEVSAGRLCFDVVAGTRGISDDADEDARWLNELKTDPKESKEHNMALERYERRIGSLCSPESVSRDKYMDVRTLRHVRHLFSRVSGKLMPPTGFFDLLAGSSPPLCSYPAELIPLADPGVEPTRYYGGMIGRLSPGGGDACCYLNLRSLLLKGRELFTQGGVGVIRESIPRQEMLEVSNKLRNLRESVAAWEALS